MFNKSDCMIQDLNSILPPIEQMKIRGESDFYGISYLIAKQIGLPFVPWSGASWKHGWLFSKLQYSEQLNGNKRDEAMTLVSKKEHEIFLKKRGMKAKAVGMPFIYALAYEEVHVRRLPNSLLVMPPHSIPTSTHSWDEVSYAKAIADMKNEFDVIVVCLYHSCVEKGLWINAFEKYGIPWIIGARSDDKNSLLRMNRIFRSFEYVTTNAIGSHIVYAAYSGCKVSIYGPYAEYSAKDYEHDFLYQKYPFLLSHNLQDASEVSVRKRFPMLFTHPKQSRILKEWAASELGETNLMPLYKLAFFLGWYPHQQLIILCKKIFRKVFRIVLMTFKGRN